MQLSAYSVAIAWNEERNSVTYYHTRKSEGPSVLRFTPGQRLDPLSVPQTPGPGMANNLAAVASGRAKTLDDFRTMSIGRCGGHDGGFSNLCIWMLQWEVRGKGAEAQRGQRRKDGGGRMKDKKEQGEQDGRLRTTVGPR